MAGMMEAFAIAVSVALQYGVPLKDLVNKFSHTRFEPAGFTTNPDIPMAKSLIDYIFRYLATKFLSRDEQDVVGVVNRQMALSEAPVVTGEPAVDTPTSSGFATSEAGAPPAGQLSDVSSPERGDQTVATSKASELPGEGLDAAAEEEVLEASEESHQNGLLDGLKIVAQAREERLNVGQPTVIFDTANGERIELDHLMATCGFLPEFAPVEIGGRLLGDGGFSANAPIEPVLLDEWQVVPNVLRAVANAVNADPRPARFFLTGSARAELENEPWPGTGRIQKIAMYPMNRVT